MNALVGQVIFDLDNDLSIVTWSNADLSTGSLGTNVCDILIRIQHFSFIKVVL